MKRDVEAKSHLKKDRWNMMVERIDLAERFSLDEIVIYSTQNFGDVHSNALAWPARVSTRQAG